MQKSEKSVMEMFCRSFLFYPTIDRHLTAVSQVTMRSRMDFAWLGTVYIHLSEDIQIILIGKHASRLGVPLLSCAH